MKKIDVAIIGAGSGGLTVAYTAKGFGKSVLLIDKNKPGGECTWAGCIPSKALINKANEIHIAKKYSDFKVDTSKVMKDVRNVIENVYKSESEEVLEKDGIEFLRGVGKFKSKNLLEVNGEIIEAKKIFISTGSSPMIPPIDGLKDTEFLTNENIFNLEKLPESIVVLGGGAIGVELSQAMNRLGVKVNLVEMADNILPKEDIDLSTMLKENLEKEGVKIYTSSRAVKVLREDGKVNLMVEGANGVEKIIGDEILVALGRVPNINDLDLEKIGIKYNKRGIEVNKYLETTCKGVYGVGDVVGPYMFSHMANAQGIKAAQNAILPFDRKMDYSNVVWTTFTSPELATLAVTEKEAREKYKDQIRVYTYSYDKIDRAKTKEGFKGSLKLILNKKGKVLGCTILGDRAGEIISEVQVVKTLGVNFGKLSNVIHPYPTYGEILNKVGKKVLVDNLMNLPIVKFFRK